MQTHDTPHRDREPRLSALKMIAAGLTWLLVTVLATASLTAMAPAASASEACTPADSTPSNVAFAAPNGTTHYEYESSTALTCDASGNSTKECKDYVYENGTLQDTQSVVVTQDYRGRPYKAYSPRNGTLKVNTNPTFPGIQKLASTNSDYTVENIVEAGKFKFTGMGYIQHLRVSGTGPKRMWFFFYVDAATGKVRKMVTYSTSSDAIKLQMNKVIDAMETAHDNARVMARVMPKATVGVLGALISVGGAKYGNFDRWSALAQGAYWLVLGTCAVMVGSALEDGVDAGRRLQRYQMRSLVESDNLWDIT